MGMFVGCYIRILVDRVVRSISNGENIAVGRIAKLGFLQLIKFLVQVPFE